MIWKTEVDIWLPRNGLGYDCDNEKAAVIAKAEINGSDIELYAVCGWRNDRPAERLFKSLTERDKDSICEKMAESLWDHAEAKRVNPDMRDRI